MADVVRNIRLTEEQETILFKKTRRELFYVLDLPHNTEVELLEFNIRKTGIMHIPALIRVTYEDTPDDA